MPGWVEIDFAIDNRLGFDVVCKSTILGLPGGHKRMVLRLSRRDHLHEPGTIIVRDLGALPAIIGGFHDN